MSNGFFGGFEILKRIGFFDVILPTLLVYAIVFGILERAKLFKRKEGKEEVANRSLNAIIAFAIALLFVGAANVTGTLTTFLPYVGLLSVLIVTLMMLLSLTVGDYEELVKKQPVKIVLGIITFTAFVFTFGLSTGWWGIEVIAKSAEEGGILSAENISMAIMLLIILGAMVLIYTGAQIRTKQE